MEVIKLSDIREGAFLEELNHDIREATRLAHVLHDKVHVVVTFTLEPRQIGPQDASVDGVELSDSIVLKRPKPAPGVTTLYVGGDEIGPVLSKKNPKNLPLPLASVSKFPSRD